MVYIIIAVVIALVIIGAWAVYFFRALLPAKMKSMEAQARQQAEQEAEVIKQKKLLRFHEAVFSGINQQTYILKKLNTSKENVLWIMKRIFVLSNGAIDSFL